MRFDPEQGAPASDLVNTLPERELADLIWRYGEEPGSRRIARAIVRERERAPIETTTRLAEIVARALGGRRGRDIHPATRTFQALRIATNEELAALEAALAGAARRAGAGWAAGGDRVPLARRPDRQALHRARERRRASVRRRSRSASADIGPGCGKSRGGRCARMPPRWTPTRARARRCCAWRSVSPEEAGECRTTGGQAMTPLALESVLSGTGAVAAWRVCRRRRSSPGSSAIRAQVQPGDLFIAVRGERFDGHDFVADAAAAGASAALVRREWADEHAGRGVAAVGRRRAGGRAAAAGGVVARSTSDLLVVGHHRQRRQDEHQGNGRLGAGAIDADLSLRGKSQLRDRAAPFAARSDAGARGGRARDGWRLRLRRDPAPGGDRPAAGSASSPTSTPSTWSGWAPSRRSPRRRPSWSTPSRRTAGRSSTETTLACGRWRDRCRGRVLFYGLEPGNDVRATDVESEGLEGTLVLAPHRRATRTGSRCR